MEQTFSNRRLSTVTENVNSIEYTYLYVIFVAFFFRNQKKLLIVDGAMRSMNFVIVAVLLINR